MNIRQEDECIYLDIEGAELTARILNEDSVEYELEGLSEEKITEFYKITKYHDVVLIESLNVKEEFRGKGLASLLLKELEKFVKSKNLKFMYLNACPILAENGFNLEELETFYQSKGFKVFLNQGKNTLMVRDLKNQ